MYVHDFQSRWPRPLPKCAYRWRRLFEFWHPKRAWHPSPLLLWVAPSMPECVAVANVFQGCAIYAGILKSRVSKPPHIIHPVGCARFFFSSLSPFSLPSPFPLLLSLSPFLFSCPLPFLLSLSPFPFFFFVLLFSFLLSPDPFSCPFLFLLSPFPPPFPFPFPFPFSFPFHFLLSFSPFSFLLSLLLSISLYKWKAVVTYRWRNPQLWFPKEQSCCLSLSLSPFSFPSSFHCPFPFLLFPSPFPCPFPFLLSPFPLSPFLLSPYFSPFPLLFSLFPPPFPPPCPFPLQMERSGNL